MGKARKKPRRSLRGAVLAEFAIAFLPIASMFLILTQLARYSIARMFTEHAAMVSARACAVIIEPDPGHDIPVDGPDEDYQKAADVVMAQTKMILGPNEVKLDQPADCKHTGEANGGTDTVTLQATYECGIPLARSVVCPGSYTRKITITAQFPHQGAEYELKKE